MEYLNPKELKKMMLLSWERVEREKEDINKINIFPVPDQDTGSNMARTLLGIKEAIENKEFEDLSEISTAILEGALTAAQGNAGVIYTGFLAGFLPHLNKNPVNAKNLAQAFKKGAKRARLSIQDPKEGTILDVIDAAAMTLEKEANQTKNITDIFKKVVVRANEALLATRDKMEIFRKANVVDAGGLGFLIILESYLGALEGEKRKGKETKKPSAKTRRFIQTISTRYEVVSLIKNPRFTEKEIQENLKSLGNSLDMVRVGDKMKIHIHTDFVDEVKKVIRESGTIQSLRVEDMAKEVVGEESLKKISIGIVTDAAADLTAKIIERYKIEVIQYPYEWPEGKKLSGENIYQKMRMAEKEGVQNPPKTSLASPQNILKTYKKQLKSFDKVLVIMVSSKLSGGYNAALQARKILEERHSGKVYILDSLQGSAGQALLVLRAIELIQEQREISEVVAELKKMIPKIQLYAFLKNPKWLEWGGRITRSQSKWLSLFQKIGVRPLIKIKKGRVKKTGFRFGPKSIPEAIFREIKAKSKEVRVKGKKLRMVITHADNLEDAKELRKILKKGIGAEVSFINLVCPVVGVHVGPGSLIVAWAPLE
jgi:DegV family protein with EDD domain